MTEFADLFSALEDPRASNARRHSLHDILVIAFCAMLCGGQTCTDMELFGHAKRELLQSFLKLSPATILFRASWGCRIGFPAVVAVYASHDGRENLAPTPCGATLPAASGQRLGRGTTLGIGASGVDDKSNDGVAQVAGNADSARQSSYC